MANWQLTLDHSPRNANVVAHIVTVDDVEHDNIFTEEDIGKLGIKFNDVVVILRDLRRLEND